MATQGALRRQDYWDLASIGNGGFLISWQLRERRERARAVGSQYFRSAVLQRGRGENIEQAEVLWDGDVGVGWVIGEDRDETIVADSLDGVLAEAFPWAWPDVL